MTTIPEFIRISTDFSISKNAKDKRLREVREEFGLELHLQMEELKKCVEQHTQYLLKTFWDDRLKPVLRLEAVLNGVRFHGENDFGISWTGLQITGRPRIPLVLPGKTLETRDGQKAILLPSSQSQIIASIMDKKGYMSEHKYSMKGISSSKQHQFDLYSHE